ncbi:mesaconyl-C4 CoA hydratase [Nocardia sp. NPDC052112]|uniref:FAS1-like dehydratase domain-containing protein n=1 Tax=Nocardia sp. NPDC052112 TaxID=3155646 RepID=UPI00342552A7
MSEVFERTEVLVPGPAEALSGLLGVPVPDLAAGLPLLWHWIYLLERPAQADLGPDGHPIRNTVPEPPGPGRRRMWAGGSVRTRGALICGEPATKRTKVLSTAEKQGRTGALTFLVVGHQILQGDRIVVDERQDIVYRDAVEPSGRSGEPEPVLDPKVPPAEDEWAIDTSPTLLFRYSALTYNGHRIHYDRDYARDVEGYPGLLVHGPLQALAMAEAARAVHRYTGDQVFDYRLRSPLFDYQGLVVSATRRDGVLVTVARDGFGRQTATGTLHPAD